jgi:hypothetical protein
LCRNYELRSNSKTTTTTTTEAAAAQQQQQQQQQQEKQQLHDEPDTPTTMNKSKFITNMKQ